MNDELYTAPKTQGGGATFRFHQPSDVLGVDPLQLGIILLQPIQFPGQAPVFGLKDLTRSSWVPCLFPKNMIYLRLLPSINSSRSSLSVWYLSCSEMDKSVSRASSKRFCR